MGMEDETSRGKKKGLEQLQRMNKIVMNCVLTARASPNLDRQDFFEPHHAVIKTRGLEAPVLKKKKKKECATHTHTHFQWNKEMQYQKLGTIIEFYFLKTHYDSQNLQLQNKMHRKVRQEDCILCVCSFRAYEIKLQIPLSTPPRPRPVFTDMILGGSTSQ